MLLSFGNTLRLGQYSARVLLKDRNLLVLAGLCGLLLAGLAVYFLLVFQYGGAFERIIHGLEFHAADFIFIGAGYLLVVLLLTYFHAVVACTAYDRHVNGTGDFRSGIEMANDRLGAIVLWGMFVAWVLPVLRMASVVGLPGRVGRALQDTVSPRALVVPSMLLEGLTPFEAATRARELHRSTWGSGERANFGFVMLGWSALAGTGLLATGVWQALLEPISAVFVAALVFAVAWSLIKTLERLVGTALYGFASSGRAGHGIPEDVLRTAYGQTVKASLRHELASRRR